MFNRSVRLRSRNGTGRPNVVLRVRHHFRLFRSGYFLIRDAFQLHSTMHTTFETIVKLVFYVFGLSKLTIFLFGSQASQLTCAVVTSSPTTLPSLAPSRSPSLTPTSLPSVQPTLGPSPSPSLAPSAAPTQNPSRAPTNTPTVEPTFILSLSAGTCSATRQIAWNTVNPALYFILIYISQVTLVLSAPAGWTTYPSRSRHIWLKWAGQAKPMLRRDFIPLSTSTRFLRLHPQCSLWVRQVQLEIKNSTTVCRLNRRRCAHSYACY